MTFSENLEESDSTEKISNKVTYVISLFVSRRVDSLIGDRYYKTYQKK